MNQKGKFILLTREEFKKWLLDNKFKRQIKLIQNHHTAKPNYSDFANNHFKLLDSMESFHINVNKMSEIAQNITTFPDGIIAIGRSFEKNPAGIKGANTNAICIENLGNFDINGNLMSEEHKKSIIFINAVLCIRFNIKPDTNSIVYHHWYDLDTGKRTNGTGNTKTCPGTNFFGGNAVEAATKNFIPLVLDEFNRGISTKS